MHGTAQPGSVPGTLLDQTVGIAGRYLTKVSVGAVDVKVKTDGRPPVPIGGTVHLTPDRNRIMLYVNGTRIGGCIVTPRPNDVDGLRRWVGCSLTTSVRSLFLRQHHEQTSCRVGGESPCEC